MKNRIGRCTAAIALAVAGGAPAAPAQRFTCVTIQAGDTAADLAWRLTGDAAHRRKPWFQIVDPRTSRIIAKRDYSRISPGWHACVPERRVGDALIAAEGQRHESGRPDQSSSVGLPHAIRTTDARIWWVVSLVLAMPLAWCVAVYARRRRDLVMVMRVFGERFVREFERPLMRPGSDDRPLRSRLRCKPFHRQLDILLAPNDGRTYPNLSDHKGNVEYDVGRVLRRLEDERFVGERLSGRGRWVIVRCRFTPDPARGGEQ